MFSIDKDFDRYVDSHTSNPRLWAIPLRNSLRFLNTKDVAYLLDCGGGDGQLEKIVTGDTYYFLLDRNVDSVARSTATNKVVADATKLPFSDCSFDLVVSISTMQYIDHDAFLSEARRILRPGGTLAIHENGRYNPVIFTLRLVSRLLAIRNRSLRTYLSTITEYISSSLHVDGFRTEYRDDQFILSPIIFALQLAHKPRLANFLAKPVGSVDRLMLLVPGARRLCWWHIRHYVKLSTAAEP